MLLSETHLATRHTFLLLAYTCYRHDRPCLNPWAISGGTAVLVHRRIPHRLLPPPAKNYIEACAVALCVHGVEVRLVLAYFSHGCGTPPPEELHALFDHLPTIVFGDLNFMHPSWNSQRSNSYSSSLRRAVVDETILVIGHSPLTKALHPNRTPIILLRYSTGAPFTMTWCHVSSRLDPVCRG